LGWDRGDLSALQHNGAMVNVAPGVQL